MAKFDFSVLVAFATQTEEGTYNTTLDEITTTLSYTQGLILGDPESGVGGSGLTLKLGRNKRDKAFYSGSFSRPLSDFLNAEVPTFTFAFPFCGNRATTTATPVDTDFTPIAGFDALMEGAGLVGASADTNTTWRYAYGTTNPISALINYYGNRIELKDCRTSLSISFPPGSIPICTATVEVGSVNKHEVEAAPTPTWGTQETVSAPTCVDMGNAWQETRGFSSLTIDIAPSYESVGDMNADTGFVKESSDRETKITGTIFADSAVDAGYEYSQLIAASTGTLDALTFQVGDTATGSDAAEAVAFAFARPELQTAQIAALGTKAGVDVELLARGASANTEMYITFQ